MHWLAFLILCFSARAQTTLIVATNSLNQQAAWNITNSITVSSNQIVTVLSHVGSGCYDGGQMVLDGFEIAQGKVWIPNSKLPITIAGPVTINFYGCGLLTYKITPKEESIQPGTGVVIPSDATGPVEIILESSADLVNWSASVPGIYGANTTNRFFRVRAIRH